MMLTTKRLCTEAVDKPLSGTLNGRKMILGCWNLSVWVSWRCRVTYIGAAPPPLGSLICPIIGGVAELADCHFQLRWH